LVSFIGSAMGTARKIVSDAMNAIVGFVRGIASKLWDAGKSAIGQLLSGISSAMSGIGGWIKSHVVDPVVNAVKNFFGIHSPSSVMAEVGKNVTAGFIEGVVKQNPLTVAKKVFGGIPGALAAIVGKGIVSLESLPSKALKALGTVGGWAKGLLTKIGGVFSGLFGGGAGAGVMQWSGLMHAVLAHFGIPQLFGTFMTQMQTESGGNPRAINLWDSNARAGIPSQGLMQVIPPTFAAYAGPYVGRGIMDPLANIYAAVAYAISRYGASIAQVLGHGHGYAAGGVVGEPVMGYGLRSGTPYSFGEAGPELVSPLSGGLPGFPGPRRPVVVNVYPRESQSEVEIARAVSRQLAWVAQTGGE
jgi:hypothetical protein